MGIRTARINALLQNPEIGSEVTVSGWVRTRRGNKNVQFIALNDGSCLEHLQVVAETGRFPHPLLQAVTTGACVRVSGTLVASPGAGQSVELQATTLQVLGAADPAAYPLQKKGHSLEFLRTIAHLRPRTNTFGAVLRIRHQLSQAIHRFFSDNGFVWLHTPIITASDCEGAGAMFRVTTLDPSQPPRRDDDTVDFSADFFGQQTSLTVSGQLEGELGALALGLVYTFGPTFRAENSNTARHLAEFWMVEPEMAFYDLDDTMQLAEQFLQSIIGQVLDRCVADLDFLAEHYQPTLPDTLRAIVSEPFARISYTEAIAILDCAEKAFEFPAEWGCDLQAEHERYLVENHFGRPVIVYDYPRDIKAFYMKQNKGGQTVRALDILFPHVGEIVGGSQREDDHDLLRQRISELQLPDEDLWWYLDTRRFGSAPHSGFGLGFDRLVQFVTGMANIRDVIPFPRTPQNAAF